MGVVAQQALRPWTPPEHLGARMAGQGTCSFRVWAPRAERVELVLESGPRVAMRREPRGYWSAIAQNVIVGTRYRFSIDGEELPDPASRWQPYGVHGASAVLQSDYDWTDGEWRGLPLEQYVLYELHVGTFTPEGTFDAIIPRLPELRELGITAIELLPIAEFPGSRNWGYDGVFPFAAHSSYGGPQGLRRLVDAAHAHGIAVVLDVVYNHLGPEGNYLPSFGPYFTERYRTPWGDALNFDGEYSDEVRAYFIASALQWIDEFHIDALRLDAVHAIVDASAYPFLRELADTVRARAVQLGRDVVLIAESDLADPRMIRAGELGGMHMHAQWVDDFHHALHALLTGERQGYYVDYGDVQHLGRAYQQGYVYAGDFTEFRKRRHGLPAVGAEPQQFVVFAQNHDQVGNRLAGDRLTTLLTTAQLRLIAGALLLGPYIPLLFMGEEYGEKAPFPYFVSHGDPALVEAVRNGRKHEFAAFGWQQEPPDPQAEGTCASAVLQWHLRAEGAHAALLALHRDLLAIRRRHAALLTRFDTMDVQADGQVLHVRREGGNGLALLLLNFSADAAPWPQGDWERVVSTADARYGGGGADRSALAPHSATLLIRARA